MEHTGNIQGTCLEHTEKKVQFYVLFIFCFTLFYLILENMSTNVRKFSFSCYN